MKVSYLGLTLLAVVCKIGAAIAQPGLQSNAIKKDWWHIDAIKPYKLPATASKMSYIKVQGNSFVNDKGKVIVFKGLSISDPDKLVKDGHWNKKHFEVIKSWGANLIRIPVHPVAYHQRGVEAYIKLLDEAVNWCSELGIYVLIDWHAIGNLQMEVLSQDMHKTTKSETFNFWRNIAEHYKDIPTVAFYELFNEPTTYDGQYGTASWDGWKTLMEQMIDLIYVYNKNVVPLVAGFNWAYDLTPVKDNPIARPGIGYVTHPYPGKRAVPREDKWELDFGFVADKYPVIATELGFMPGDEDENLKDDGIYGPSIIKYFNKKGISWVVWVFDPDWIPQMIKNWNYEPTSQGKFFSDVMKGK
ncbi:glycoside hydrolase family 5 protein [Mucilaginibacter aquatilis]|uniref:Cellulase family glycosylhydrolase n=1 Tax=Mucilaginibacter aquatilis TaxID=1517760 RepID=A0A6I4IDX6_9SPHI|nr:cellulase family glycosylhydrolase [Mucilaginibacter aquatilis]MVN91806.1 cellulase family glycosylhydrolase [Mucilaginibacter aquatilis]